MFSENKSFELKELAKSEIQLSFSAREGETKLGQVINNSKNPRFVILGIEESVGPRANKGRSGAENGFKSFLNAFNSMQSNESLEGGDVQILGKVIQHKESEKKISDTVEELDNFIFEVLELYINDGQIPIVIGGGHNNAFPLIKFSANRNSKSIDVVNLDAHADYRLLEGRHSGNPFSYAFKSAYLNHYCVFGLHQRYNSQQILDDLRKDQHSFTFNESYLLEERNYLKDFKEKLIEFNKSENYLGLELDLDVIERMPSSAFTPVGISISTARQFIRVFGSNKKIAYLHLPEGAPKNEEEEKIVGKTLAYLVCDFINVHG